MKKVININFQGRIIPIEENAFELLKQYIESLRRYFSSEDGRDEIINDIENRIAELFSERLAHGTHCITDEDTLAVIKTIGRPEDFEESASNTNPQEQNSAAFSEPNNQHRGKFYRNADDKLLGGVCSGLANYLKVDPVLVRIAFVLLIAALFWVYILLWLIVPSKSLATNITKRFYRNPDAKIIGGVCGGLAAYFDVEIWIPRLIFALPFFSAIISSSFNSIFWQWHSNSFHFISGSLGGTLFLSYIILWIAVPMAKSASDLLEMKGEKIDINSIRDTVKDNFTQFQSKAEDFGAEVRASANRMVTSKDSGFVQFLKFGFKGIFFFVAGIVALSLLAVFIAFAFGGMAVFPLKNLLLNGALQNALAWSTLILFIGVPIIAIITWLIRRIAGIRTNKHYLASVFGFLFFAGFISALWLFALLRNDFKRVYEKEELVTITQPISGKLKITVGDALLHAHMSGHFWNRGTNDESWIYNIDGDTIKMENVKVEVEQSPDSLYHIYTVKSSRGVSDNQAQQLVAHINFDVTQQGDQIILPKGLSVSKDDHYRNQQVLVVVGVPLGKQIEFDKGLERFTWVDFRIMGSGINFRQDDFDEWEFNTAYKMTPEGLEDKDGNKNNEVTNAGKRSLNIFSQIVSDASVKVILHASTTNYVVVNASLDVARLIETSVHNGILTIDEEGDYSIDKPVIVDVYSPRYESIELSGSGDIITNETLPMSNNVVVNLNGSGNITLLGKCEDLKVNLGGSGNIDLKKIACARANIELSGSGNIDLNVKEKLQGDLSGSGNISNSGKAKSELNVSGSGRIIQL
jgi:phage shock protein PspC (stress-responsive transcriptional regulator)